MRRFLLTDVIVTPEGRRTADVMGSCVCVADFPAKGKMLVKQIVPDGTPMDARTIADVTEDTDGEGRRYQVDINADALSAANRTTIKTWLTNQGLPSAWIDATITDRRKLLLALMQKLAARADMTVRDLLDGYDCN